MANNPYKNKVVYNGAVLIDLTEDTVTENSLITGYTAHDASGKKITGLAMPATGSGAAVTISDTLDTNGGTIRTITGVDISNDTITAASLLSGYTAHDAQGNAISGSYVPSGIDVSDTTAVAADVTSGKYFYTADGLKTLGTLAPVWVLLGSKEYTVNTTETTATSIGSITVPGSWNKDLIIYIRVRDKAGKRAGYFYGSDAFFMNYQQANGTTTTLTYASRCAWSYTTDGKWYQYPTGTTTGYGVYGYSISSAGSVNFRRRYSSDYSKTVNGTFLCQVYSLRFPDNVSPFA